MTNKYEAALEWWNSIEVFDYVSTVREALALAAKVESGTHVVVSFNDFSSFIDAIIAYHSDDAEFCHNIEKDFARFTENEVSLEKI